MSASLPFDLRHLQAFQAAVAGGSLTAGADTLHVSQPALSATIAGLERRVGTPLLIRTARGVEPTAAGRYLLDASTRILSAAEETAHALRGFGEGTLGSLTVAAVPALLTRQVPDILAAFAATAPDVELTLLALPPWQAIDLVAGGGADVALVLATDGAFAGRREGAPAVIEGPPVPLRLALPASDADTAADAAVPAAMLAGRTLLVPRRTPGLPSLPEAVERYLHTTGVTPRALRTVDTIQTMFPLVAAGQGVAVVPHAASATAGVVLRRLDPDPRPLRLHGVHRPGPVPPAVARLLSILDAAR